MASLRVMLTFAVPGRKAALENERVAFIDRLRASAAWPKELDTWSRDKSDWGWVSASEPLSEEDKKSVEQRLQRLLEANSFKKRRLHWGDVAYDFPTNKPTPEEIVETDADGDESFEWDGEDIAAVWEGLGTRSQHGSAAAFGQHHTEGALLRALCDLLQDPHDT